MSPAIPQLPLALGNTRNTSFDSLIGLSAPLRGHLEAVAEGRTAAHLCVVGGRSSGKSHLLIAITGHARRAGLDAAYLSMATLRGSLGQVLPAQRAHRLVCLDQVDTVLGLPEDEEALFHFHNALGDAGGSVVYALSKPVAEMPVGLPDLRSRLAQCEQIVMQPLDDAGRTRMLQTMAATRGMELDEPAIQWMLRRFDRDASALVAALDTIDRQSLAAHRRVTIPFLRLLFPDA